MDPAIAPGQCDHDVREVLFVIPTEITHPYFIRLYGACERRIFQEFGWTVRPVLRSVERQFEASSIREVIEREFEMSDKIRALVVAPTENRAVSEAIADIVKRMRSRLGVEIPVIALSLPFHHPEEFVENGLRVPPMVICDSERSAEMLGRRACATFYRQHGKRQQARALLIHGSKQRKDSQTRLFHFWNGFLDEFNLMPRETVGASPPHRLRCEHNECGWTRAAAREFVRQLLNEQPSEVFNVVFAANDDMALGVVDAIFERKDTWTRTCMVYGFDGIDEMCHLVKANHPNLKGTAQQNVDEMSQKLVEILQIGIEGKEIPPPILSVRATEVRGTSQSILDDIEDEFRWHQIVPPLDHPDLTWLPAKEVSLRKTKKGKNLSLDTLYQYRTPARGGQLGRIGICGRDKDGRFWQAIENDDGSTEIYYLELSL